MVRKLSFVFFLCMSLLVQATSLTPVHTKVQDPVVRHIADFENRAIGEVTALHQDKYGFLWLGTTTGLYRYDGTILRHYDTTTVPSLAHNLVLDIVETADALWLTTYGGGLHKYDFAKDTIKIFGPKHDNFSEQQLWFAELADSELYIGGRDGGHLFDVQSETQLTLPEKLRHTLSQKNIWRYLKDKRGDLWIATLSEGLYRYIYATDELRHYPGQNGNDGPADNIVRALQLDAQGRLWIGTDNGLSVMNTDTEQFQHFLYNPDEPDAPDSLAANTIWALHLDSQQRLWVGARSTNLGLSILDTKTLTWQNMGLGESGGLSNLTISVIEEDDQGNIWLGTHTGLYQIPASALAFSVLSLQQGSNNVTCTYLDSRGVLWVATDTGIYQRKNGKLFHVSSIVGVNTFVEASDGNIWATSINRGLVNLSPEGKLLHHFLKGDAYNTATSNFITVAADGGAVWAGVYNASEGIGLMKLDLATLESEWFNTNSPVRQIAVLNNKLLLGHNNSLPSIFDKNAGTVTELSLDNDEVTDSMAIMDMHIIDERYTWIASHYRGLWLADSERHTLTQVSSISNSEIWAMWQTNDSLWLASTDGLLELEADHHTMKVNLVRRLDAQHGLPNSNFNAHGATFDKQTGMVYLGTLEGLVLFDMAKMHSASSTKLPWMTRFSIINQSVSVGSSPAESALSRAIELTESITLGYEDYVFSLDFATPDFVEAQSLEYAYKLEGLDTKWFYTDSTSRKATYTTLPAGKYRFLVKSKRRDEDWPDTYRALDIEILPPWWHTWQAYLAYGVIYLILMWLFVRHRSQRLKQQARALQQAVELKTAELNEQNDELKQNQQTIAALLQQRTTFFTNVSHELRTPLSLLSIPLEHLQRQHTQGESAYLTGVMSKSLAQLRRLVEQLMTLARLDSQVEQSQTSVSTVQVCAELYAVFNPLCEQRNIRLSLSDIPDMHLSLIPETLQTCLANLLSNAVKYSFDGGDVRLTVSMHNMDVHFCVQDQGCGIAAQDIPKIFERFSRAGSVAQQGQVTGSGIGLTVVKELALANGGDIRCTSELGKGSTFTLTLPASSVVAAGVDAAQAEHQPLLLEAGILEQSEPVLLTPNEPTGQTKPLLLVIDDNVELRELLSFSLSEAYTIETAQSGQQGIDMALQLLPDLVICDLMMPDIDGFDVTQQLREHALTSHIPIIMLTAKSETQSRLKGWQQRVDDYIAKPFNLTELTMRIDNLLAIRQLIRKRLDTLVGRNLACASAEASFCDRDKQFLQRFEDLVRQHYQEPDFNRSFAAKILAVSERQLNRKLSALLDHNFADYLRRYRVQQAATFLRQGTDTPISHICELVGFASSSYLASCFKAEFGVSMREYRQKHSSPEAEPL